MAWDYILQTPRACLLQKSRGGGQTVWAGDQEQEGRKGMWG